ncbi:TniB family NTP-binding protein [Variovorax sp. E3]|uniref:TniB family NTP-binding protein n=1 Tax=Variovorax sp. E3 TaxID=1914993 RepID=UPI0018DE56E7|nr:TniB family NTP-binding protein [Variovorax sp. E3]
MNVQEKSFELDHRADVSRERWRGVALDQRIRAFQDTFIKHSDLADAEAMIDAKTFEIEHAYPFDDNDFEYKDTITYGSAILMIGESGAGKTTFAHQLMTKYPRIFTPNVTYLSTVYMRVPSSPTERAMGVALLNAMGHPDTKGNADDLLRRITILMRKCRVRRLLLDDFQDIPATRRKGIQTIGDWVRKLIDATPCLVIAMGTPDALVVRDSNDQLQRRMQATVELLPFVVTTTDPKVRGIALKRWSKIMESIDEKLPLAETSNLSDSGLSVRLLLGSNARFGHLSALLKHGIKVAFESGSEQITGAHLRIAFKRTFGSSADNGNPFEESYDGEPLTQPGQAFAQVKVK